MNNVVTDEALTFAGKVPYVFGGWSPVTGWDCSGFAANILGIHFGLILPEMKVPYTGQEHGPDAASYRHWDQAVKIDGDKNAIAGDLLIWDTHIGFALDNYYMLSALNETYGTAVTPIAGFGPAGEGYGVHRLKVQFG
jgi:cell wall-associated NlpC family hydrolase